MPHALGLENALAREAARFEFFQALRWLEAMHPERPPLGCSLRPREDPVRLGHAPTLGFTAADLARYQPPAGTQPARLTVNAIGLFGPNSPMPLYFTEYAHNRMAHAGDPTIVAFLDMFHHRQLSLFYRAWAASQPVATLEPALSRSGGYGGYVASLCGLAPAPSAARDAAGDLDKLQFCSLLATRTRHASGLGLLLSEYFGVPVAVRQFVGMWLDLARQDRTALRAHAPRRLGAGLVLGTRVWDRQSKFRVVIGPVGKRDMRRLLPGTASHRRLIEWVSLYTGGLPQWDVELRIKPEAAVCTKLGGGARLAYTTWLGRGDAAKKPPMLRIQPRGTFNTTR